MEKEKFIEDWDKYNRLMQKEIKDRTTEENDYCKTMYHIEEYYAGLL